jgi:hypothetical protein
MGATEHACQKQRQHQKGDVAQPRHAASLETTSPTNRQNKQKGGHSAPDGDQKKRQRHLRAKQRQRHAGNKQPAKATKRSAVSKPHKRASLPIAPYPEHFFTLYHKYTEKSTLFCNFIKKSRHK